MVNKEKASKRDLIRIRKSQNPQQIDFRRLRKHRKARTEFWSFKKKPSAHVVTKKKEKDAPRKKAPRRRKKPELEVIDQEPELEVIEEKEEAPEIEVIDEELEELYSYDDDILDDDELEVEE
jgi:hypothetical protein